MAERVTAGSPVLIKSRRAAHEKPCRKAVPNPAAGRRARLQNPPVPLPAFLLHPGKSSLLPSKKIQAAAPPQRSAPLPQNTPGTKPGNRCLQRKTNRPADPFPQGGLSFKALTYPEKRRFSPPRQLCVCRRCLRAQTMLSVRRRCSSHADDALHAQTDGTACRSAPMLRSRASARP